MAQPSATVTLQPGDLLPVLVHGHVVAGVGLNSRGVHQGEMAGVEPAQPLHLGQPVRGPGQRRVGDVQHPQARPRLRREAVAHGCGASGSDSVSVVEMLEVRALLQRTSVG